LKKPDHGLRTFDEKQMAEVNEAVAIAEEITSNHFKYSSGQWRRSRYDIRTLKDLVEQEITDRAFAQILGYVGQPRDSDLGSSRYDFYKVCLQDHVILRAQRRDSHLAVFPLIVYVVTHELVHIVRFSRYLQSFEAFPSARDREESLVHGITAEILEGIRVPGIEHITDAYGASQDIGGVTLDRVAKGS
jgi:hypothetical protein